jgi:hypothetical protein
VNGSNQFAENRQQYYNRMCEGMVEELMSRYGDLAIVWFDGGAHGPELGGPNVLPVFEKYQSTAFFTTTPNVPIFAGAAAKVALYLIQAGELIPSHIHTQLMWK